MPRFDKQIEQRSSPATDYSSLEELGPSANSSSYIEPPEKELLDNVDAMIFFCENKFSEIKSQLTLLYADLLQKTSDSNQYGIIDASVIRTGVLHYSQRFSQFTSPLSFLQLPFAILSIIHTIMQVKSSFGNARYLQTLRYLVLLLINVTNLITSLLFSYVCMRSMFDYSRMSEASQALLDLSLIHI